MSRVSNLFIYVLQPLEVVDDNNARYSFPLTSLSFQPFSLVWP